MKINNKKYDEIKHDNVIRVDFEKNKHQLSAQENLDIMNKVIDEVCEQEFFTCKTYLVAISVGVIASLIVNFLFKLIGC